LLLTMHCRIYNSLVLITVYRCNTNNA